MSHPISEYNKALVAIGGAIIAIAGVFGTTIDPGVVTSVVTAITAVLVLAVPNRPRLDG